MLIHASGNIADNQSIGESSKKDLDAAAEIYRKEMGIDKATWDKIGDLFQSELATKPLLVEEFSKIYAREGKVAAIRFAHQYVVKNMAGGIVPPSYSSETTYVNTGNNTPTPLGSVTPNAYGPGINMDATGRPVTVQPAYPNRGGNYSDSVVQNPDVYDPGIGMHQYCRPVQYQ